MSRTSQFYNRIRSDRGEIHFLVWVSAILILMALFAIALLDGGDEPPGINDEPTVTQSLAPKIGGAPIKPKMPDERNAGPQKPSKRPAVSGVCARRVLGEYPKIALHLLEGRTIPGWGNGEGEECVDAEAWLQLIDDSRAVARERAEKRLDKAVATAGTGWIGKLDVVTQWVCDGNATKSQEWAVANDTYARYWRVSIEYDVPEDLLDAVNRFCPRVEYYDAPTAGGTGSGL